ncbi:hypothetical protein ABZ714_11200 [Streptomyces sp. NPDC006798]|uniref:hypothetical protein n=1 Tax=Streptomyces sp. NPDC006798 TaxID=3155462 RepID=UPI00340DFD4F
MTKDLAGLDHRIERATGHSPDRLSEQRDRGLLDGPLTALVDARRALVRAQDGVDFHRVLLHRLASGEHPADETLLVRIDRAVRQMRDAIARRDALRDTALTALEPVEAAARTTPPVTSDVLSPRDRAALLAIARGARLREHLLTQRVSVVAASGIRISAEDFRRLERDGLVDCDTTRSLHAGQPVTLTGAGRAALAATLRCAPPYTPSAHRPGAWPAPAARPRP